MAAVFSLPGAQALDGNGNPYSGAKLYFFNAGTTTPKTVYSDSGLTTPISQPVIADSAGRFVQIFMQTSTYRVQLKTSADVLIGDYDNNDPGNPASSGATALPVASGGTGATTGPAALANLGAAAAAGQIFTGDIGVSKAGDLDVQLKSTDASASNFRYVAIDATNENGVPVGTVGFNLYQDGSCLFAVQETAAGSRTVDRRVSTFSGPAADAAAYRANVANRSLTPNAVWAAAAFVTLTDAATVALDMSTGINFILTATSGIGATRTMGAPSNPKVGQTGVLVFVQDGSGSRALTWNAVYDFAGGAAPTASTAANAIDLFGYFVRTTGSIVVWPLQKAIS